MKLMGRGRSCAERLWRFTPPLPSSSGGWATAERHRAHSQIPSCRAPRAAWPSCDTWRKAPGGCRPARTGPCRPGAERRGRRRLLESRARAGRSRCTVDVPAGTRPGRAPSAAYSHAVVRLHASARRTSPPSPERPEIGMPCQALHALAARRAIRSSSPTYCCRLRPTRLAAIVLFSLPR